MRVMSNENEILRTFHDQKNELRIDYENLPI